MQWTLQTCLCPLQISNKQLNSTDNKLRKHTVLSNLQTIKPTVAFWPYLPNYKIGVLLCICELAIYALYLLAFLVKMNLFVLLVKHHLQQLMSLSFCAQSVHLLFQSSFPILSEFLGNYSTPLFFPFLFCVYVALVVSGCVFLPDLSLTGSGIVCQLCSVLLPHGKFMVFLTLFQNCYMLQTGNLTICKQCWMGSHPVLMVFFPLSEQQTYGNKKISSLVFCLGQIFCIGFLPKNFNQPIMMKKKSFLFTLPHPKLVNYNKK